MEFPMNNQLSDWSYKKFEFTDIFHSKMGIAVTTSVLTFGILAYINPPFVQENNGSKLQIHRPSIHKIGSLSAVSFCILLFVSLR
ncbi:FirrV-1-A22 [Feldmannia irregularis virus a]|uniref:FirrV-1-A22 n=1 Tax=Feldmannia irregularis virus a TaxID=231992 RepID=Q6XM65_9PHYC|nr:FirrV-1-A22 [Feldmannia irregularis virus a]AAR26846.1 FirrV-1-A22 [Feldmannia irregularis virus a]